MSNPTFHWWLYQVVKWCLIKMSFLIIQLLAFLCQEELPPKSNDGALIIIRVTRCFINTHTAGLTKVSLNQIRSCD